MPKLMSNHRSNEMSNTTAASIIITMDTMIPHIGRSATKDNTKPERAKIGEALYHRLTTPIIFSILTKYLSPTKPMNLNLYLNPNPDHNPTGTKAASAS
jgi:hypothetical protein